VLHDPESMDGTPVDGTAVPSTLASPGWFSRSAPQGTGWVALRAAVGQGEPDDDREGRVLRLRDGVADTVFNFQEGAKPVDLRSALASRLSAMPLLRWGKQCLTITAGCASIESEHG
jgi:hypothetical protein